MPEGDNVRYHAHVLRSELQGRTLARVFVRDRGDVREFAGRTLNLVESRGKHLLLHIDGGWVLRIHLGMNGGWVRRHVRERPPANVTAMLVADETAYICRDAFTAELMREEAVRTHPRLSRLGPDLLAEPPDIGEMVRRAKLPAHAGREIGDLIMDQRIAAGIGNIYKSETLFECRVHPRTHMHRLTREKVTEVYERGAQLMRLSLLIRRRTAVAVRRRATATSHRLWVYGRRGKPCLDCGTPIEMFMQGDMHRSTYFCPHCQAAVDQRPSS